MQTSDKTENKNIYFDVHHAKQVNPKLTKIFNRSTVKTHFREKRVNRLNGASEYSLPNSQIKDLSQRSFSAMSRKSRKEQKDTVVSSIKGRLYCMKLGEINNKNIGFEGMFDDYYSLIYSDKVTEMLRKPLIIHKSRRPKQSGKMNCVIQINNKNIRNPLTILPKSKLKKDNYTGQLNYIIESCTDYLRFRSKTIV